MLKALTPSRCLALLACISCILVFTLVPRFDLLDERPVYQVAPRGLFGPGFDTDSDTATSSTTQSSVTQSSTPPASSPPPSSPPASQQTNGPSSGSGSNTSTPPPTSSNPPSSTSSPPSSTSSNPSDSATGSSKSTPPPTPSPSVSASVTVNPDGETSTVFYTTLVSGSASSSASTTPTAGADQSGGDTDKGVGTSTIIGLSVAGGIAFLGIIAFVFWKFTRKRGSDDFDDSEAIKWPELNAHGENPHALPTNRTGGAGFETSSEVNLTRPDSRAGSIAPSAAASAVDLYAPHASQDPYAVPPLPHLNPNQPYRDDPSGGFYDPYSGPIPQTFTDPHETGPGGEAIPMTQINRMRSPAPQMAYDAGRRSPGPQAAYFTADAGRNSPAPRAMSPGPAMGLSGRASPGPGMALAGRASPGPQAAYGYGRQSPGPNMAYGS